MPRAADTTSTELDEKEAASWKLDGRSCDPCTPTDIETVEPTVADTESNPLPTPRTVPAATGEVREARRRLGHSSGDPTVVDSSEDEGFPLRGNRFAAFDAHGRLVLVSQQGDHGVEHEWDSDTDTVGGGSDVEVGEILEPTVVETPVAMEPRVRAPVRAFASLDAVDLSDLFETRAKVMRSVPHVLRRAFRMALRVACQEIIEGIVRSCLAGSSFWFCRGRMMLFRPSRGGTVSRKKLESRVRQFQEGNWISLLRESVSCADVAHSSAVRRRRGSSDEEAVRATRALSLVQMGELSAARQALEGASLAPGNLSTLGMLTDPTRNPLVARSSLSPEVLNAQPSEPFILDRVEFLTCLRKSRRGAAAGPSGMTSDHLFPLLENEGDSERLAEVASLLAVGRVPDEIIEALRLGRLTALSKPDGWLPFSTPSQQRQDVSALLTCCSP